MKKILRSIWFFFIFICLTTAANAVNPLSYPKFKGWNPATGTPLTGGKLYSYYPGGESPKNTFSDSGLITAHSNPVILDSYGEANVYLSGSTKLVLKTSAGVTVWTMDNVTTPNDYFIDAAAYGSNQAGIEAAITAIGANQRTLNLTPGNWSITGDMTIPSNITLKMDRGAVLAVATTKTVAINGTIEAGPYQIFSCTGTGKIVFGPGVTGEIYPEWWGAKGDGTTNSTTAITAAWNALQGPTQYFATDAENQANQIVRGPVLKFGQGKYLFNGTALTSSDTYRSVRIKGCGDGLTKIVNQGATYFISVAKATGYWEISGIHFYGGKGVFAQTAYLVDVGAEFYVHDNWFIGYTECAIGFNASDKPYVRIHGNKFQAASGSSAIGVAMPMGGGGNEVISNDFLRNKYHLKLQENGGGGSRVQTNTFIRIDTSINPSHDIWCVPMVGYDRISALWVGYNKFGNESLGANDYRILIADEDAIGVDNLTKHHVTTVSTKYFQGPRFQANSFVGNLTWTKSYITSFTPNVGSVYWDNLLYGTLPNYILEFDAVVSMASNNLLSRDSLFIHAQTFLGQSTPKPQSSNINGVGWMFDPYCYMVGSLGTPQQYPGSGRDIGYVKLLTSDNIRTDGALTDCTRANQTDVLGGTNATTITYSATAGDFAMGCAGSITTGKLVFVEFDVKAAAATPLTLLEVRMTITGGIDYMELRRKVQIPSGWSRVRIPFVARQDITFVLRFMPGDYSAGVKTKVDVGRPSVYHANEAENLRFGSGSFTVTQNQATTTVTNARATDVSKVVLFPTAGVSAAEVATTYISAKALGAFTVTHPNNATAGRTWDYHLDN